MGNVVYKKHSGRATIIWLSHGPVHFLSGCIMQLKSNFLPINLIKTVYFNKIKQLGEKTNVCRGRSVPRLTSNEIQLLALLCCCEYLRTRWMWMKTNCSTKNTFKGEYCIKFPKNKGITMAEYFFEWLWKDGNWSCFIFFFFCIHVLSTKRCSKHDFPTPLSPVVRKVDIQSYYPIYFVLR